MESNPQSMRVFGSPSLTGRSWTAKSNPWMGMSNRDCSTVIQRVVSKGKAKLTSITIWASKLTESSISSPSKDCSETSTQLKWVQNSIVSYTNSTLTPSIGKEPALRWGRPSSVLNTTSSNFKRCPAVNLMADTSCLKTVVRSTSYNSQ